MSMDPTIKALAAIRREIRKIVESVDDVADRAMILDMGQRELDKLRGELAQGK